MKCVRHLLLAVLPLLVACGESGSTPCKPPEVNFSIQGSTGTPFRLVGLDSAGPAGVTNQHLTDFNSAADVLSPHNYYILNAVPPIEGRFMSSPNTLEDVPIFLREPNSNPPQPPVSKLLIAADTDEVPLTKTLSPDKVGCLNPRNAPDIRVEAFAKSGAFNVQFTMNLGDEGESFIACGVNPAVCGTPSTMIFDNAARSFNAVITKVNSDGETIVLQLWVDGVQRDSDEATDNDHTAKFRVEF